MTSPTPRCDAMVERMQGEICLPWEVLARDLERALIAKEAEMKDLATQLNDAVEVLEFYGDPETYFAIGFFPDPPCGEFMDDFEELSGDLGHPDGGTWTKPGKRARALFAKYAALRSPAQEGGKG